MLGDKPAKASSFSAFADGVRTYLRNDWCRVALLLLLAFLIHAPALSGELIWDDGYLAHDNPLIKSPLFLLEVFRHHLFLDSLSAHYRPVQTISFICDYFFWNDNPYGYHLTNIALHAASGVLLYFLLRRVVASFQGETVHRNSADAAYLIALLWIVHPVHSAAVDYISGRADSLAFVFSAGAWLVYLRGRECSAPIWRRSIYFAAAALGLLALCSRETAGLWLLIFLLHNLAFQKSSHGSKAMLLASCLVLFSCYAVLHQLPEERAGSGPKPAWSAPVRVVLMLRALGDYGRLMVFPSHLHMERTVVAMQSYDSQRTWEDAVATEYLSLGGLLVAASLAAGCIWQGRGRRARIFGASWFVIGFLPISNLFNLNATVAEHWLYLPSVGLLIFAAGIALDLPRRLRPALIACAGIFVVAFCVRSALRSSDWTTPEHFYKQTLADGGTSTRVALNLGQLYAERGDYARAAKAFREILAGFPDYPVAQTNLANALYHLGKKKEAEALFAAATKAAPQERREYPRTWIAALNLAGLREQENDLPGALAILGRARGDYPRIWEIVSYEAELRRRSRGPAAAIPIVEKFRSENWWSYPASLALGQLYAENGEVEKAEAALRRASWLDIHEVDALNRIADLRLHQNRLADACAVQRRAVARQPDRPREYLYLSRILAKMGRVAEAQEAIAMVARLQSSAQGSPAAQSP